MVEWIDRITREAGAPAALSWVLFPAATPREKDPGEFFRRSQPRATRSFAKLMSACPGLTCLALAGPLAGPFGCFAQKGADTYFPLVPKAGPCLLERVPGGILASLLGC